MSFAPKLTPAAAAALPAICHDDGTARPQTVAGPAAAASTTEPRPAAVAEGSSGAAAAAAAGPGERESWLYGLLSAVKAQTGWGVLINTSFNSRGKPILNTAAEALGLLADCDDLDYVLIEDWLFSKEQARNHAAAASGKVESRKYLTMKY